MSKHQKHRASSVDVSTPLPAGQRQPRRRIWQTLGVLAASVVLGFAFNSSSPVGIRFNDADSESNSTKLTTEASSPTVAAPTNQLAMLPPLPSQPADNPQVKRIIVPTPPPSPSADTHTHTRQLTPASPVAPPATTTPAIAVPTTPSTEQNPAPIHWNEAKPLVDAGKAVLVDVRAKPMYDAGHIPGAISLPETSSPEEFAAFLTQHPDTTLILYCSSTSCSQSARVAGRFVTQYQRSSVKYMTGGYMEYQQLQASKPSPASP